MALSDKDIIITPNRGQTADPVIAFSGASTSLGPQTINLRVYPDSNGTLSFEGSAGQLFSITNDLTGTIFSVNDVSGIPSIEVNADGTVRLAQYSGNTIFGNAADLGQKLQVAGTTALGTNLANYLTVTGSATGQPVTISTAGSDANVNLSILTKGNGNIILDTGTGTGDIEIRPGASNFRLYDDDSSHFYRFVTGNTSANYDITLPAGNVTLTAGTSVVTTRSISTTAPLSGGGDLSANRTLSLAAAYGDTQNPYGSKTANHFLAAPNGSAGVPSFRAIVAADIPTLNQNTTGSAATLTTGRTIGMTGDVTWTSGSFNGSANVTGTSTLANSGVTAGTYTKVTVDAKGRVTSGSTLAAGDIPTLNYLASNTSTTYSGGVLTITTPTGSLGSTTGSVNTLQVFQATANTDAFMTFHVGGDYAAHFGLDGTTNDLFYGGWSVGAVKHRVIHAGNLATSGSTTVTSLRYNGTTRTAGQMYGGTTAPSSTTRLNYDGHFYATQFHGDGSQLTGISSGTWTRKTTTYTAVSGDKIIADTTGGAFTITLPAGPVTGNNVLLADGGDWKTNNLTVARNGQTIEGLAENLVIDIQNIQVELVFDGTTWQVYAAAGPGEVALIAGSTETGTLQYSGTTQVSGTLYGGTTNPSNSTRLNYDGNLHATQFVGPLSGNASTATSVSGTTTAAVQSSALGSGTANSTTYLRGDRTWATVAAGATLANDTTTNSDAFYPAMSQTNTSGTWATAVVSSTKLYFNPSTGQLNATNFNSLSDINKKTNVQTISNAIQIVDQLRGVSFNWADNGSESIGVIAQEVEQVLPCLVSTAESGEKSVSYGNIIGVLIEAIKEQQQQIEQLKKRISD